MSTTQKLRHAKELVAEEQDGSTYLQSVCTIKEMKDALAHTRKLAVKEIIQDAIVIREHNNQMKKENLYVPIQTHA